VGGGQKPGDYVGIPQIGGMHEDTQQETRRVHEGMTLAATVHTSIHAGRAPANRAQAVRGPAKCSEALGSLAMPQAKVSLFRHQRMGRIFGYLQPVLKLPEQDTGVNEPQPEFGRTDVDLGAWKGTFGQAFGAGRGLLEMSANRRELRRKRIWCNG